MTQTDRDALKTDAERYLRTYLATGLDGFKRKAIDRLKALDIRTNGSEDLPGGVEAIVFALEKGIL